MRRRQSRPSAQIGFRSLPRETFLTFKAEYFKMVEMNPGDKKIRSCPPVINPRCRPRFAAYCTVSVTLIVCDTPPDVPVTMTV
jgi:hypothetical protein